MSIRTLYAVFLAALIAAPLSAQTTLYEQPVDGTTTGVGVVPSDTTGWIYSENFLVARFCIKDSQKESCTLVVVFLRWRSLRHGRNF